MTSDRSFLIAICLIAVTMLLLATTQLITSTILGYSGFSPLNASNDRILLPQACTSPYYTSKYPLYDLTSQRASFIASAVAFVAIIVAVFLLVCFIHGCREARRRRREETRVVEPPSSLFFEDSMLDSYDSLSKQIVALYLFLALAILTSSVQLNRYFQVYAQSKHGACQPAINKDQILAFAIINSVICGLSIICLVLLLCLTHSYHARIDKAESEGISESYRHQIHRIIREIPNSERRFYDPDQRRAEQSPQLNSERPPSQGREERHQTNRIQQIQSVLYQPGPSLMLNSVVNQPSRADS